MTNTTFSRRSRNALLAGAVSMALIGAVAAPSVMMSGPAIAQAQTAQALNPQTFSFADVVERVKPAVVSIRVKGEVTNPRDGFFFDFGAPEGSPFERFFRDFGPRGPQGQAPGRNAPGNRDGGNRDTGRSVTMSQGSGFIISASGDIVTNYHVVKDSVEVVVVTEDGSEYKAKVVGADEKTDVALLRIQDGKGNFPTVPFAANVPRVGDWVLAVGNPFGLGGSVTSGIVSARGRDIGNGPYDDFLQIDASINRGNSGGPTFNLAGEVVGMNTAIYSPSGGSVGIGFAIPVNTIQQVIGQLEKGGEVVRGWLGVQIQPVTREVADSMGIAEARGALITEPQPNSPALKAGLKAGEIITAVDGRAVRNSKELARMIAGYGPGATVKLKVIGQNNAARDVDVALGKMPGADKPQGDKTKAAPAEIDDGGLMKSLGVAVAPANDVGEGKEGVVVVRLDPSGTAAGRGLKVGDVIFEVQGKVVATAADVSDAVRDARKNGRTTVLMRVKSADGVRFIAVPAAG